MRSGTRVRLVCPGNALLDGVSGTLAAAGPVNGYATVRGDRYRVRVTLGGRERELRLTADEFAAAEGVRGEGQGVRSDDTGKAREMGFTGDVCPACGSARMTRSGVCLKCMDCGDTSGGCS